MIGYVTVGTNDMPRAVAFYDALMAELGAGRMMETVITSYSIHYTKLYEQEKRNLIRMLKNMR